MADKRYLIQIDGWWRYNRRLPKDLVGLIQDDRSTKTGLIRYSLDTTDLEVAQKRRNCENVIWDAIFEVAEEGRPLPLNKNQAVRLVQEYVERTDKEWQRKHSVGGPRRHQCAKVAVLKNRYREGIHPIAYRKVKGPSSSVLRPNKIPPG